MGFFTFDFFVIIVNLTKKNKKMSLFSNLYPFLIPIILGVFIGFLLLIFYVPAENILSIEYLKRKANHHIFQNLYISFEIDKTVKIKIQNKSKYNIYIEDIDLLLFNPQKNLFINKFLVNCFNIELTLMIFVNSLLILNQFIWKKNKVMKVYMNFYSLLKDLN